jgi:hypothetical protein
MGPRMFVFGRGPPRARIRALFGKGRSRRGAEQLSDEERLIAPDECARTITSWRVASAWPKGVVEDELRKRSDAYVLRGLGHLT